MDKVTTYRYALGTGEQVRRRNFDMGDFQESPSQLVRLLCQKSRGLIIPRLIGAYQDWEIVTHTQHPEELRLAQIQKAHDREREESLNEAANLSIASRLGAEDNVHPHLIFVAYNPEIWTPSLVRDSLGNKINRIVIAPYQEAPNFYGKDTQIAENILDKGWQAFCREQQIRNAFEAIKPGLCAFKEQGNLYGLTRQEYAVLNIIMSARQMHPGLAFGEEIEREFQEMKRGE